MLGLALMLGLARTQASAASLLLNLEAVLTALLAWTVFLGNTDRCVVLGIALIVAGAVALAWPGTSTAAGAEWGAMLIAGACVCWALDNNFTRKVAASDVLFVAGIKGTSAGIVSTGVALLLGARMPLASAIDGAMTVGLLGYGASLVLFVLALCGLRGVHGRVFFDGVAHTRGNCDPRIRRPCIVRVLAGRGAYGCGRLAAFDRTSRVLAPACAAHAHA